jgi:hypothetical protein
MASHHIRDQYCMTRLCLGGEPVDTVEYCPRRWYACLCLETKVVVRDKGIPKTLASPRSPARSKMEKKRTQNITRKKEDQRMGNEKTEAKVNGVGFEPTHLAILECTNS